MLNKHTATLPDGTVAKRVSQNRIYPFAIAVRRSYEHDAREAAKPSAHDLTNFGYYWRRANGEERPRHVSDELLPAYIAEAKEKLNGFDNAADWAENERMKRMAAVEEKAARGFYNEWFVETWCGRADLVNKAAATARKSPWFAEVEIVHTNFYGPHPA